jgi:hypothetical protein
MDDGDRRRTLAVAVADLLHGPASFGARLDHFVTAFERAFGRAPGWQLATALPALVHPKEHICVRPTTFREQAKWMSPRLAIPKAPSGASYLRCLSMAKLVSNKLAADAESPRDLMDVYDFMRLTTRPAAKQLLGKLKRAKTERVAVPSAAPAEAANAAR